MAATVDAGLIAAAEACADVAGAVVRPFFRNPALAADLKGDESPVTIADRSAEQAMRAVLRERFPDHGILGEEFGLERGNSPWRWVLDPIDGTRAFITGRAQFGILIGLLHEGESVLGVIDQPVTGERWLGVAGRPTSFTGRLGGVAGCRACRALDRAEMSLTSPDMFGPGEAARWRGLADGVRRVYYGGDCYAYGLLALGQIDVIAEADLKIWDWAALAPVVQGAGGSFTDWHGEKMRPLADDAIDGKQQVLALGDPSLLAGAVARLAA